MAAVEAEKKKAAEVNDKAKDVAKAKKKFDKKRKKAGQRKKGKRSNSHLRMLTDEEKAKQVDEINKLNEAAAKKANKAVTKLMQGGAAQREMKKLNKKNILNYIYTHYFDKKIDKEKIQALSRKDVSTPTTYEPTSNLIKYPRQIKKISKKGIFLK